MKNHIKKACKAIAAFYQGFISGIWFVSIMRQVIITGGNIAESAFLLATLWVIVNAVAHTLVLWVIDAHTIELINNLSAIAFSALPELIIIPVIIICYDHWSTAVKQKSYASGVWAVLYSIPAGFFLVLTIVTITAFVSTKGDAQFVPVVGSQLVIRCLSGWMYAVVNMLFKKLGEPHYASKLEALETVIASQKAEMEQSKSHFETALQTANSNFQTAMAAKQSEFEYQINLIVEQSKTQIDHFQNLLKTQNEQVQKLSERASSLSSQGLENYPKVISELIDQGVKTVSVDILSELTGISKRRINAAKTLQRTSRNKELILVSSVIDWLKTVPLSQESKPQDTDPIPATNGHRKKTQPLDNLVPLEV